MNSNSVTLHSVFFDIDTQPPIVIYFNLKPTHSVLYIVPTTFLRVRKSITHLDSMVCGQLTTTSTKKFTFS